MKPSWNFDNSAWSGFHHIFFSDHLAVVIWLWWSLTTCLISHTFCFTLWWNSHWQITVSWGNHCGPQHPPVSSVLFTLISDYIGSVSRVRSHYFSSLPGVPELHHDWITGSKCRQVSACLLVKVEFLLLLTRDHLSMTLLGIAMSWL